MTTDNEVIEVTSSIISKKQPEPPSNPVTVSVSVADMETIQEGLYEIEFPKVGYQE